MTDGDLVYASPTALYVATPRWAGPVAAEASSPPRGATLIHKLDTSDPARTTYRASGAVRGYLLNQFSMSEDQGDLRVASTEEPDWWTPPGGGARPSESLVTVLAERDGRLAAVGSGRRARARASASYAVRFLGTRGYVVTFRQTDPLFALDLSDPAHPAGARRAEDPGLLVLPAPDRREHADRRGPGRRRPGAHPGHPGVAVRRLRPRRPRGASPSAPSTPTGRRPSPTTTPSSGGRRGTCWCCPFSPLTRPAPRRSSARWAST